MADYLDIPIKGKQGSVRLLVYPQSSNAKVFDEVEPQDGESRWQLVEGEEYEYARKLFIFMNELHKFIRNLQSLSCLKKLVLTRLDQNGHLCRLLITDHHQRCWL